MNHCYYCEKPVDRLLNDGKQHICETCRIKWIRRGEQERGVEQQKTLNLANYWNMTPQQRQELQTQTDNKPVISRCITIWNAPENTEEL